MKIEIPVIGIPQYWWHKKAFKYAKKNPRFIEMEIKDLCYECHRHKEILKNFDHGDTVFQGTKYWEYYDGKKDSSVINNKISRYRKLYEKIKRYEYLPIEDKSSIIITDDGCRIDGSHRLSILEHIGIKKVVVNVFLYEDVFTEKESKAIRTKNERYRKNEYPDIDR